MAKKNTKIQKQLEEGLKNANQVVDQQIEGKAAPKPAPAAPPTPPAAAAPSAPAAGGTSVAPAPTPAPTPQDALDLEIGKIIKGSRYFVDEFRKIQQGVVAGDSAVGLQDKALRLAQSVSGSTGGQIPVEAAMDFITRKATASASPAVMAETAAQRAQGPETQPGVVQTPPPGETSPSVAEMGIPGDLMAGLDAPENNTTATTLDEGVGLSPEQLAMLQAAETELAASRPGGTPETQGEIAARREALKLTPDEQARTTEREQSQRTRDWENLVVEADLRDPAIQGRIKASKAVGGSRDVLAAAMERKRLLKKISAARGEVLNYGSLNPLDDLYMLFDKWFGENSLNGKNLAARDDMADPENHKRGRLAMRQTLFHYALGFVEKDLQNSPRLAQFRKEFDQIMTRAGVDQELLDQVRNGSATKGADTHRPYFLAQADKNYGVQREMLDEVVRLIDELGDGGALHHPESASAVTLLSKLVTEIDSDIINNSYLEFDPKKPRGQKLQVPSMALENLSQEIVDRVLELTGEDIRTVATEEGTIKRPLMSHIVVNGVPMTVNNLVRYQTASRRRFALDRAGIVDSRWQQVDAQGLDVPSFINPMHPDPETNKAAIGFVLSTDPTAELQMVEGGGQRGMRDGRLEGAIIASLKEELGYLGFSDTSAQWSDVTATDIGVGGNIEYTLDEKIIGAETARRRAMLPTQEFVVVRLDPEKFGLNDSIRSANGEGRLIGNREGILVLPAEHPLVKVALTNGAAVSPSFRIGEDIDLSKIVGPKTFPKLRIDVDPYVFPAVKHTLPLRTPMGEQISLALVPEPFLDKDRQMPVQMYDEQGNPVTSATAEALRNMKNAPKTMKALNVLTEAPILATGMWGDAPGVLVRDIDVESSSPDWRSGVATAVLGHEDGTMPDLGSPSSLKLPAEGYEDDAGARWYLGDATGKFDRGGDKDYGKTRPGYGAISGTDLREGLAMQREDAALVEAGTPARDVPRRTEDQLDVIARADARQVQGEIGRAGLQAPVTPLGVDGSAEQTVLLGQESWPIFRRAGVDQSQPVLAEIMANTEHIPFMARNIADYRARVAMFIAEVLGTTGMPDVFGSGPMGMLSAETDFGMMFDAKARSWEGEAGSPGKSEKPRTISALGRFRAGLYSVGPDGKPLDSGPRTSLKATPYTKELVMYIQKNADALKAYFSTLMDDPRFAEIMASLPDEVDVPGKGRMTLPPQMRIQMATAQLVMDHISSDPADYNYPESEPLKLVQPKAVVPTRSVYDAGTVYEESQHPYEVSTRTIREKKDALTTADGEDVIMREASMDTSPTQIQWTPLDPTRRAKVRRLVGHLLFMLSVRGTKANWDARNARNQKREIRDIVDLSSELAAVYDELGRTQVVTTAQDAWLEKIRDRMPEMTDLEWRLLSRKLGTIVRTTYDMGRPISSTPGLSTSSRAAAASGMQFIDWEDLGIYDDTDITPIDRAAYNIARDVASADYLARTGRRDVAIDTVRETDDGVSTKPIAVYDEVANLGGDFEAILQLLETNPDAIGREVSEVTRPDGSTRQIIEGISKEARALVDELRTSKDPKFRSILIALIENKGNYRAIADSAYPDDFAKSILQEDKGKPEAARIFKPRDGKFDIRRGVDPATGQVDPYDEEMQRLWAEYVSQQENNVMKKVTKTFGKKYKGTVVDIPVTTGSAPVPRSTPGQRFSTEEWRRLAWKAYRYYSTHAAIDQAGDGWVKFLNNVLYSDQLKQKIADDFVASGGKMIHVPNNLFASQTGEIPDLKTTDGSMMGLLTDAYIDMLKETEYGQELIDFAKSQQMKFILIKRPMKGVPGQFEYEVYIAKATLDKKTGKFLEFDTPEQLTFEYGYQPLAEESDFAQTEDRVRNVLAQHGSDKVFDIIPATDNSGRYILSLRPEALMEFGISEREANRVVQAMSKMRKYDSATIKFMTRMLDTYMRYGFFSRINDMAIAQGVEPPFPDLNLQDMAKETVEITDKFDGLDPDGRTAGAFSIRRALNNGNPNLGALAKIKSPSEVIFEGKDVASDSDIESWLSRNAESLGETPIRGVDPMLDAALDAGSIRDGKVVEELTTSRRGAPLGTERRTETETNKQMIRRFRSKLRAVRTAHAIGGIGAGMAVTAGMGLMQGNLSEDDVKTAAAFEVLGAINPVASSAAALGFTAMNKGDMLRTLVNIIGGFGGGAVGAVAGTAALPVAGSFAGATAGSVAGSAIADSLYSAVAGNQMNNMVPNNVATASQQAEPDEKDPFSIYRNGG